MKSKQNELKVERNYNYTISVIDGKGKKLHFRDITGEDLEFLDRIIQNSKENETDKHLSLDEIIEILSFLSIKKLDFRNLTTNALLDIFEIVKENILCNYMSKYDWLRGCYGIQNGSFTNLGAMEKVPMTKFTAMIQVHEEAIESINKST
jgi:hypothetical protein